MVDEPSSERERAPMLFRFRRAGESLGAFHLPGDRSVERAYYRTIFMERVQALRPQVIASLRRQALPTFTKAVAPDSGVATWGIWPNGWAHWLSADPPDGHGRLPGSERFHMLRRQDPESGRVQIYRQVDPQSPDMVPVAESLPPEHREATRNLLRQTENRLLEWGRGWNLKDDWAMDIALVTLLEWSAGADPSAWGRPVIRIPTLTQQISGDPSQASRRTMNLLTEEIQVRCPACGQRVPYDHRFCSETGTAYFSPWQISEETRTEARRRILEELQRVVTAHLADYERLARSQGLQPATRKRRKTGPRDLHFDWLVRFQVPVEEGGEGEREAKIAAESKVVPKAVQTAIRLDADRIALTRRSK